MLRGRMMQYTVLGGGALLVGLVLLVFSNVSNGGVRSQQYEVHSSGEQGTLDYAVYLSDKASGERISFWHDVPLYPENAPYGVFNFVCEIPIHTTAKMEITKEVALNPIKQDTKDGNVRFYGLPSIVNYGAFPQTWEDPSHHEEGVEAGGDNDPLDVVELTTRPCATGDVYPVRVVGALALLDGGEMDWKLVVVRDDDPAYTNFRDTDSNTDATISKYLTDVRVWFRDYKTKEGKPQNEFAFDGKFLGLDEAVKVVELQHRLWQALVSKPHTPNEEMWWKQPSA